MTRTHNSKPVTGQDPRLQLADYLGRVLLGLVLVVAVLASCTGCSPAPGAPTDTIGSRSTMAIITDPDTGCQYLGVYGEAITKRVAADGYSHMGCRGAKL